MEGIVAAGFLALLLAVMFLSTKGGSATSLARHALVFPCCLTGGGLVGAAGSAIFHGTQAAVCGAVAGVCTALFALVSRAVYGSTHEPQWQAAHPDQRPGSLFTAVAVPVTSVLGLAAGWLIPTGEDVQLMMAPFFLSMLGVLLGAAVGVTREAIDRHRRQRHSARNLRGPCNLPGDHRGL